MKVIDLNCDMAEGMGNEEALMPFITSANISCGFHAGNSSIIGHVIELAQQYRVQIGAHPSFHDKENFGRKEQRLSTDKIYAIVLEQLIKIDLIARDRGTRLHHVKPHGALYNMSARDPIIAIAIAQAVFDFNETLVLYGLSGSHSIKEAIRIGLKTRSEVFSDRSYMPDGSLTSRDHPKALINDIDESLQQVRQMVEEGTVISFSGEAVPILAETICFHGDGPNAIIFAQKIHQLLQQLHFDIQTT